MNMKTKVGDLIELAMNGEYDVIVQGCNCKCQMGKGIALTIKQKLPAAYAADCLTTRGDPNKLGTISTATINVNGNLLTVVNGYTQYDWKGEGVLSSVDAIKQVMLKVKELYSGKRIAFPLIGAGLARGDWKQIAPVIEEALEGEDYTLVVLPQ